MNEPGTNGGVAVLEPQVLEAEFKARFEIARAKSTLASEVAASAKALSGAYRSERTPRTGGGNRVYAGPARCFLTQRSRSEQTGRVQDLLRNNTIARMMGCRLKEHVVGDGFAMAAKSQNPKWNIAAQRFIRDKAEEHEVWQLAQSSISSGLSDGDCLIVKLASGTCQTIEAQQLVSPGVKDRGDGGQIVTLPNGNLCFDGVEVDRVTGQVAAYHVAEFKDIIAAKKVPTNGASKATPVISGQYGVLGDPTRIPAAECMQLKWPLWNRPGQYRGEPGFQAAINRINLIDSHVDSVNVCAQMATLFGLVVKSEFPNAMRAGHEASLGEMVGLAAAVPAGQPKEIELESGLVQYLRPGESVEQVDPKFPNTNTRDFVLLNIQLIASELGLPLMLAAYEFGSLTASNAKVLLAIAYRGFGTLHHWQRERLWRPWLKWQLALAIRAGQLPFVEDWSEWEITPPTPPVIDMASEVAAWAGAVNYNFATVDLATQQLGTGNATSIREARAVEVAEEKRLGVTPSQLPGAKPTDSAPKAPAP